MILHMYYPEPSLSRKFWIFFIPSERFYFKQLVFRKLTFFFFLIKKRNKKNQGCFEIPKNQASSLNKSNSSLHSSNSDLFMSPPQPNFLDGISKRPIKSPWSRNKLGKTNKGIASALHLVSFDVLEYSTVES